MQLEVMDFGTMAQHSMLEVNDKIFASEYNEQLVYLVKTVYESRGHGGSKKQKTRAEVRASTRKIRRQKGGGCARAGSIASPIRRGGGRAFAARVEKREKRLNRKMYRGALRCILSQLLRDKRLVIVDKVSVEQPKTRLMQQKLAQFDAENALVVMQDQSQGGDVYLAARNLPMVKCCDAAHIDPVSLIRYKKVIMTADAVKHLEEQLA